MKLVFSNMAKVMLVLSFALFTISYLGYKLLEVTRIKFMVNGKDLTDSLVLFFIRLIIVSISIISVSILSVFLSDMIFKIIGTIICLTSLTVMLNLERLPIWEEE